MNINFTVEEYFKELELMQKQYGQEEELYPWIYMLLQMAEQKKRIGLGEFYKSVSIRDVHNARKNGGNNSEILNAIKGKNGYADIVILERDSSKVLGGIEIKKIADALKADEKSIEGCYKLPILELSSVRYEFKFEVGDGEIKELENQSIRTYTVPLQKGNEISIPLPKDVYEVEIRKKSKITQRMFIEVDVSKSQYEEVKNNIEGIKNAAYFFEQKDIYKRTKKEECDIKCKHDLEILSHLENMKKVIYTNGKEFYFFKLWEPTDEQENSKFTVDKLADLTKLYDDYCKYNEEENSELKHKVIFAANLEWDKLLTGLAQIDWHSAPIREVK